MGESLSGFRPEVIQTWRFRCKTEHVEVNQVALGLEGKKAIVDEVAVIAAKATSAVLAEYRGLTVAELTSLRVKARQQGVYIKVVRNTLARRAVEGTDFACLQPALVGPVICAFSLNEPATAARVLKEISKGNDKFKVTALAFEGKLMDGKQLDFLASLPTKDEAYAMLARTLLEIPSKVARVLQAVADQKQAA